MAKLKLQSALAGYLISYHKIRYLLQQRTSNRHGKIEEKNDFLPMIVHIVLVTTNAKILFFLRRMSSDDKALVSETTVVLNS